MVNVVQHHQNGNVLLPVEPCHQLHDFQLVGNIQISSRFVQQQYFRLLGDAHGNPRPLPLTAGKRVDLSVGEISHSGFLQSPVYDPFILCASALPPGHMCKPAVLYQCANGNIAHRIVALGKDCNLSRYLPCIHFINILSVKQHLTGAGPNIPADSSYQCCLAASIGPDDGVDFPLLHLERNILNDLMPLIACAQMIHLHHHIRHVLTSAADTGKTEHPGSPLQCRRVSQPG